MHKLGTTFFSYGKTPLYFISIFLVCLIIVLIPIKILPKADSIIVDINRVISNVHEDSLGINLNFLLDNNQITSSLKQIKIGSLRYPMGELADYYLFDSDNPKSPKNSVQDPKLWFSIFSDSNGIWKKALNFDDFVSICRSVNSEPFIVIGIDAIAYNGKAPHATKKEVLAAAVEWVKYSNIIQKYNIKYWEIGNENDLKENYLNWTPEKYSTTVVEFSRAMKAVDPSIKIGANGMTSLSWWDKVMPIIKKDVDFIVTHQYSSLKSYEQWKNNTWNYTANIEDARDAIANYNPELRINVTENSSTNNHANNTWKMLHNFEMLGNTLSVKKVDYLHFWISRWFEKETYLNDFSAFDSDYKLTPIGHSISVWGNFIRQQMVYTSNLDNVRSWASYDRDDRSLSLFLLNKDQQAQQVAIKFNNYDCDLNSEHWILKGYTPDSTKVIWQQLNPLEVKQSKIKTKLEPLSVTVLTFKIS